MESRRDTVRALENRKLEIFWHHKYPEKEIIECIWFYRQKHRPKVEEMFILYDHGESPHAIGQPTGRFVVTSRGNRFYFRSETDQCNEGIMKRESKVYDSGLYVSSLNLLNGQVIDSPIIDVTVYKGW